MERRRPGPRGVHRAPCRRHRLPGLAALLALQFAVHAASAQPQPEAGRIEIGPAPSQDALALRANGLADALAALPGNVAEILKRSGVPGAAVAVVHGGKTVFAQGFGVREIGKDAAVEAGTVFQIASLSKSLAATVAAIQVTNGFVAWSDPVTRHLPAFRLSNPYVTDNATIGDFYAHRSGLPAAAGDDLEDLGFSRKQILARLAQMPLDPFRISYHYANFGTTIGAEAVAAASRQEWEALADRVLYQPLGMTSTSSRHADYLARGNRAVGHVLEDGRFQPLYDRDPDAQSPAGGVSSSVLDLAEWLKLLLADGRHDGKPMIAPQALLAALSPQAFSAPPHAPDARPGFYGYGFNVSVNAGGRTAMGHSDAFLLGAGSFFQIIPSADVGIVVLTNGGPVGAAEAIGVGFMDVVQYGASGRDWYELAHQGMSGFYKLEGDLAGAKPPADAKPAQALAAYAGHYDNAYFGPAEVKAEPGGLVLTLGPRGDRFVLSHWSGDSFAMSPSGENAPKGSRSTVRFSMRDGGADTLTVEYLNKNGLATWHR